MLGGVGVSFTSPFNFHDYGKNKIQQAHVCQNKQV